LESAAPVRRDDDRLADAIRRYHELCRQEVLAGPAVVERFVRTQREAGLTFGQTVLCRSLRPGFVTPAMVATFEETVAGFYGAIRVIEERALTDPALASELGLSETERLLCAVDPGYDDASCVGRLDALWSGRPVIIEYNADSPAGISFQAAQAALFREVPVFAAFAAEYELREMDATAALRRALLSVWDEFRTRYAPGRPATPSIAIVDLAGAATGGEFSLVARDLHEHSIPALVAAPEDLRYEAGDLRVGGRRIDLVYKRLLVADFLARYDLTHPLACAYRDHAVCVASSFRCTIAHKKRALAILYSRRGSDLLDARQRDTMRAVIAPTSRIEEWTDEDLAASRRRLVIKPNDGHGGADVQVGAACDESTWRAALVRARGEGWVVQDYVPPARGVYPIFDPDHPERGLTFASCPEDRDAYVLRGRLGSILTRLGDGAVINVSRGGQAIPTFVLSAHV
jgi:uncharacterized circularly permuted ATP-grasp superfamily protein